MIVVDQTLETIQTAWVRHGWEEYCFDGTRTCTCTWLAKHATQSPYKGIYFSTEVGRKAENRQLWRLFGMQQPSPGITREDGQLL